MQVAYFGPQNVNSLKKELVLIKLFFFIFFFYYRTVSSRRSSPVLAAAPCYFLWHRKAFQPILLQSRRLGENTTQKLDIIICSKTRCYSNDA